MSDYESDYIAAFEEISDEVKRRKEVLKSESKVFSVEEEKYVAIPAKHWWQFLDVLTRKDELIEALIKLNNLIVGRLDRLLEVFGVAPPTVTPVDYFIRTDNIASHRILTGVINTATPLFSSPTESKRAVIYAPTTNPSTVWIGGSNVGPDETGFPLPPNSAINVFVKDLSKVYYYSPNAGNELRVKREW